MQVEQIMEDISEAHDKSSSEPSANQTPVTIATNVDNGQKRNEKRQPCDTSSTLLLHHPHHYYAVLSRFSTSSVHTPYYPKPLNLQITSVRPKPFRMDGRYKSRARPDEYLSRSQVSLQYRC
ncbi:hypothetical protein DdX_10118 [Ditylenchus destructor]|uniref:Uncharacterized protein n=1 Tax=Ditylenchus destructor TaxID=166010 RepID=A0AAD4R2L2_9BILA|nr:hypothetical protein DdX_10118 [Ditylenchus destructor]